MQIYLNRFIESSKLRNSFIKSPTPGYPEILVVAANLTGVQIFRLWIRSIKNLLFY